MIDWTSNQTRLAWQEIRSTASLYGRGSRVVRWAYAYRRLRNRIYYGLQQQWVGCWHRASLDPRTLHVLLHLRGGLGDACALWTAVLVLRRQLPQAVFYYYTDFPHAAQLLCMPDAQNRILPFGRVPFRRSYDLACELCLSFKTVYYNRARIAALAPQFLPVLKTSLQRQEEMGFFLQDNYLLDDALGRFLYHRQASRLEAVRYLSALDIPLQQTGSLPPQLLEKDLSRYGLKAPYITVHSGINTQFALHGKPALKCWRADTWDAFLKLFKQQFPQIQIVQLGGKNSPRLHQADVCLVGQTPLTDLPALIQGARLHIDGESGLVQLTRWLKTKAVVLFGPTAPCLFALEKNINLTADKCGSCMWLHGPIWHTQCALGYPQCENLAAITPQQVLTAVKKELLP